MHPQNRSYGGYQSTPEPADGLMAKFSGGDNPMKKRALKAIGGVVVLIILAIIVSSVISNLGKAGTKELSAVGVDQSNLNNLSTEGIKSATAQAVKNLATTTQLSMISSGSGLLSEAKKTGQKISVPTITANSASLTTQLTTAVTSGTFDTVYLQTEQGQLNQYGADLKQAFASTPSPGMKKMLSTLYQQAQLLQTETTNAEQSLQS